MTYTLIDIRITGRGPSVAIRRYCFDLNTDGIVRLADCDFLLSSQVSWRIRARPGAMLLDPRAGTRGREMSDRLVKVAATQMACGWDIDANLAKAGSLVRRAAQNGANIILIQEPRSALKIPRRFPRNRRSWGVSSAG